MDFRYAFFMFSIAAMESQQGLLWWYCGPDLKENLGVNFFLSLGLFVTVFLEIPMSIACLVPKFETYEDFLRAKKKNVSDFGYARTPLKSFVVVNMRQVQFC